MTRSPARVLLDGADVRSVTCASVRDAVAIVGDDPFLFSAIVAENIAYARPDASRSRDRTRPPVARRRTTSSRAYPRVMTRESASAG